MKSLLGPLLPNDVAGLAPAVTDRGIQLARNSTKRAHQVKVTLNQAELALLDSLVGHLQSDRASAFRYLLEKLGQTIFEADGQTTDNELDRPKIGLPGSSGLTNETTTVVLAFPSGFDVMPGYLQALAESKSVILNLTLMEPDQAQRAVDFVAGGTFYAGGHQERIGESIFFFAPPGVVVEVEPSEGLAGSTAKDDKIEEGQISSSDNKLLEAADEQRLADLGDCDGDSFSGERISSQFGPNKPILADDESSSFPNSLRNLEPSTCPKEMPSLHSVNLQGPEAMTEQGFAAFQQDDLV